MSPGGRRHVQPAPGTLWVDPVALRYASAWVGIGKRDGMLVYGNLDIRLGHVAHRYRKTVPASELCPLAPGGESLFRYPLEERFSQGGIRVSFTQAFEIDGEPPGPVLSSFRATPVRHGKAER